MPVLDRLVSAPRAVATERKHVAFGVEWEFDDVCERAADAAPPKITARAAAETRTCGKHPAKVADDAPIGAVLARTA